MRWLWRKVANMTILRWATGDGGVAKRILMWVVSLRVVFDGWVIYGFCF
jgi:hypothetical protein